MKNLLARGLDLESRGEFAAAEQMYRAAETELEHSPADPLMMVSALEHLASAESVQMRYSEAERLMLRALSLAEHAAGADSRAAADVLWRLAGVYGEAGQTAAAEPLLRRYEAIVLRNAASDPPHAAADLGNIGRVYLLKHAANKALEKFERALELLQTQTSPDGVDLCRALLDRASALWALDRPAPAIADVERAALIKAGLPKYPALELYWGMTAGAAYAKARRKADAEAAFQDAIQEAERSFGPAHPVMGLVLRNYASALHLLGRKKEAAAAEARSERIYAANRGNNALGSAVDIQTLR